MNDLDGLPVVFGVTGHRDVRQDDVPSLEAAVTRIFTEFRAAYPATPLLLLTPLAAGADRLVARVAIALGIRFRVPMPLPEAEYRTDFTAEENAEFDVLLAHADAHYELGFAGDTTAENLAEAGRRSRQYAAVGYHIAKVAHVLIALWDGEVSDARGGTADVVDYRLFGSLREGTDRTALLDPPPQGAVYHVYARRTNTAASAREPGSLRVRTREGDVDVAHDPFRPLYARIERFNVDRRVLDPATLAASGRDRLRDTAEKLATHFQRRYRLALDFICATTFAGACCIAVAHDKPPRYELVVAYSLFILLAFAAYRLANRNAWKDRAIEYRALEMGLTIQRIWDAVGLDVSPDDYYLRIQRTELGWLIRDAIRTVHRLSDGRACEPRSGVLEVYDFVAGQVAFFRNAAERDGRLAERYEIVTNVAFGVGLVLTFLLFLASLVHFGAPNPLALAPERVGLWSDRLIRGIAVATILAAVSHEYAIRRAFRAQARRYTAILPVYERAQALLETSHDRPFDERLNVTRDVAREVGREALAENAEWLLMQRELPIELLHV
jgi:hypothetical protein